MQEFELKVWRLHPQGVRIIPAERTLNGSAHPDGLKYCGPFTNANKFGFWVFPPMDIDIVYRGENKFEHTIVNAWEAEEVQVIRSLVRESDPPDNKEFCKYFGGRAKVDFGRVEQNIAQIWTGVILQTPPGWALQIRSPINVGMDAPYRVQEGILEVDWMIYDIWINVAVQQKDTLIQLRRDQWPPLAQLVPVRKESYDKQWTVTEELINRDSDEADKVYNGWADYNYKKYLRMRHQQEKDPGTYYKERSRQSGKRLTEPETKLETKKLPKPMPKRFIKKKT